MSVIRCTHIDHCTLIVTNVEKARQFYGELLGLREIAAPREFDFVALWYDLGGQYLHLLLKPQPDSISPRHICLHVESIAELRHYFRDRGVPIDETVKITTADRFFIRDPDGNRIELLHWESSYNPSIHGKFSV